MSMEETLTSPEEVNEIPAEHQEQSICVCDTEVLPEQQAAADPVPQPEPVKAPKQKKKPHIALRILLQLISFALCLALFATAIAGVLLLDLRQLTSAGGIKQLINILITSSFSAPDTAQPAPQVPQYEGVTISRLSSITFDEPDTPATGDSADITVDEDGNISVGGGSSIDLDQIPEDILGGDGSDVDVNGLVDWLYDQIDSTTDQELTVTREQMQSFVEQSTISDFLAEKLSEYADDFINGTENATITTDEIIDLLEENADLMKSELQIELTTEQKDALRGTFTQLVEENDLSSTIREQVNATVDKVLDENNEILDEVLGEVLGDNAASVELQDIQAFLQTLTSTGLMLGVIAVFVLLIALLCLANFYNVPAGLTWAAMPCIIAGGIVSLPIAVLQNSSEVITDLMPDAAAVVDMLASFAGLFAPIHYGLLILGAVLLVTGIIWRIIRKAVRKKKLAHA